MPVMKPVAIAAAVVAFFTGALPRTWGEELFSLEKDLAPLRERYHQKRESVLQGVVATYVAELRKLEKKFAAAGKLEEAVTIRKEIQEAEAELLRETARDLREALIAYKWSWHPGNTSVKLDFATDGRVHHIGMTGSWKIVGKRQVLIDIDGGPDDVLMEFDDKLTRWAQANGNYQGNRLGGDRLEKKE